jgi:hypothetical protein
MDLTGKADLHDWSLHVSKTIFYDERRCVVIRKPNGLASRLCRTVREMPKPAVFGALVGREPRLDPQLLQRYVLRPAQCHDGAEKPQIEIPHAHVNRKQKATRGGAVSGTADALG